jgi:hypothetical protein
MLFNMTQKNLRDFAERDTPKGVHIPDDKWSIAQWALGRFGIGLVFAAMLVPVYLDLRKLNESVLDAFIRQTVIQSDTNSIMRELQQSIERLERANQRGN